MKWPRTPHLPNSPGVSSDDKILSSLSTIKKASSVVYTEKLDGECLSLHRDMVHARSEDSQHHESRSWIKQYHAQIKHVIPENIQIVGEYMYARHSILYDALSAYFYVFAEIDKEKNVILSLSKTLMLCDEIGLLHVPVLLIGLYRDIDSLEYFKPRYSQEMEGYVVRITREIPTDDFGLYCAKWVRSEHIQTDEHWKKNWERNHLKLTQE